MGHSCRSCENAKTWQAAPKISTPLALLSILPNLVPRGTKFGGGVSKKMQNLFFSLGARCSLFWLMAMGGWGKVHTGIRTWTSVSALGGQNQIF